MHSLLRRQISRLFGDAKALPKELDKLFQAIDATYQQADIDRAMTERSLDIASQEMLQQNRALAEELKIRKSAESQLLYLTNYDELTGLVNRNLLNDRLKHALVTANRHQHKVVVVILGLDHFKVINDSLGPGIGNELLKIITERLTVCVRGSDTVARLGGDEFALVLVEQGEESARTDNQHRDNDADPVQPRLTEILQRIMVAVSRIVLLAGQELQITCSIGVSQYPQDGDQPDVLLMNANAALSSAKQLGRNNYQFYTADLSTRLNEKLTMQGRLRLALERDEFILHYQPQVDLRTGHIIGMEALIRWNQPDLGMVAPGQFIGLAEETGLILPIGAWVIRSACAQCKNWQDQGLGKFRIAINLSVRQFGQSNLVSFVRDVLQETGLEPQYLEIELTESLVMTDVERSIDILRGLKALGVQLSIDDFGTGYSSLSYLKRFPIDVLKIDQTFVRDIHKSDGAAIVNAIISMAHSLGMHVIAEGVETEAQCDFLRANLCDEIQGFLFSKGLPGNEVELLLRENRRLPDRFLHFAEHDRTLLLLDDDENILAALKRVLRHENCIVLTASSARAALELLASYQVDVIISDQQMPEMTGVEFFNIVRQRYPETIRIVLSGYADQQSIIDGINEGIIYQFMMKPWNDTSLRCYIEDAFKQKELVDENRRLKSELHEKNLQLFSHHRQVVKH
ncbi:EAL domain-containing protein [Undibacterium sp. TS12]|uniref:EAL domain-containing protein n=1 Tax=Undibacterium sp. TS12 TaxID=2908202 RepID=UPI001F4D2268|nr:EAL domain-containing protein [Undibacterium sp. TS12]MCH8622457.1 EAL domain-containing protein [Undibacterium sp. TS12]